MDGTQIAALVGTVLGSIGASFAGTWYMLVRPMSQRMAEQQQAPALEPRPRSSTSRDNLRVTDIAHARMERLEHDVSRLEELLRETTRDSNEAVSKRLTTEEFQAYTTFVTSALHSMTGAIGELKGQLMQITGRGGGRP